MNKIEFTARYGEDAYIEKVKRDRQWWLDNPDKALENSRERHRKGGRYYATTQKNKTTGIQGEKNKIREKHGQRWREYKKIIAPDSQCHHEWIAGTSKYRGVALVEKVAHQHGSIDVILILDGIITVLTEAELKKGKMEN